MVHVRCFATLLVVASLAAGLAAAGDRPTNVEAFLRIDGTTRVIAHRGFSARAPENTLAAVRDAIEIGADMVEIDVTMTADGHVIAMHDETLGRTTNGRGPATDRDLDEIRKLDAGGWFSPDFAGERVPTLIESIDTIRGRILLNIEIKPEAVEHGVVEKVAELVAVTGMRDQVVVSSFAPEALLRMRRADPEIVTISLFNDEIHVGHDPLEIISEIGSRGINLSKDRVTPEIVERCHRHGFPVGVYTVNREAEMRRLIEMGVDSIFTDHPDRLIEVLRSAGPAVASGSD